MCYTEGMNKTATKGYEMKPIALKTATEIQIGDVLSQSELVELGHDWEYGQGNSHIFVTSTYQFGHYVEIGYARKSGNGILNIGLDEEVLTYASR